MATEALSLSGIDALYGESHVLHDVSFALGNSGTGPFPVNPTAYLVNAATGLAGAVTQLQGAGARYILDLVAFSTQSGGCSTGNAASHARSVHLLRTPSRLLHSRRSGIGTPPRR